MYKLQIDYLVDISTTSFHEVRKILNDVSEIYQSIDVDILFNYLDCCNIQKYITYDITSLYQILGLFKLDKQEIFNNLKHRTLMISSIPIKHTKDAVSMNLDIDNNISLILVNYYNSLKQKSFTYKQKVMITAHEIAHSIGASHTPNKIRFKYTIMNPFVPDDNEIILKFSSRTKKDIHKFLENINEK